MLRESYDPEEESSSAIKFIDGLKYFDGEQKPIAWFFLALHDSLTFKDSLETATKEKFGAALKITNRLLKIASPGYGEVNQTVSELEGVGFNATPYYKE